ncbi:hypothetical protein DMH88_17490 [Escherichia coli]|nr:hypothetical protein [Escherichia coli]
MINIPVGIIGAIATLMLMPKLHHADTALRSPGFLLLAAGMAVLTSRLDGRYRFIAAGDCCWLRGRSGSTGALSAARPKITTAPCSV